MAKIIQIQRYNPNPEGSGGSHRVYQNYQNLITSFGESEINVISLGIIGNTDRRWKSFFYKRALFERLSSLSEAILHKANPIILLQALMEKSTEIRNPFGLVSLDPYFRYLEKNGNPNICIVDHPLLIDLARYNHENNIVTIYCSLNLESFTNIVHKVGDSFSRIVSGLQWMAELEMLNLSQERLMISLLETNVVRGLGLSAIYYPYLPVNEIRSRLIQIRQERITSDIDKGLFLMIGSIFHEPTGEGFRWLVKNVKENGLPAGMRIVVGGVGGEDLAKEFGTMPDLEIRGRLPQDELNGLMKRASAMLIPQQSGFGEVTRISEMACAGIPVIISEYALASMKSPPCVKAVPYEWNAWVSAMEEIKEHPEANTLEEYEAWEALQPKPLMGVIAKYL